MKLGITLRLLEAEKNAIIPIMINHGWEVDPTGWLNRDGELVNFIRDQEKVCDFPTEFVGHIERRIDKE